MLHFYLLLKKVITATTVNLEGVCGLLAQTSCSCSALDHLHIIIDILEFILLLLLYKKTIYRSYLLDLSFCVGGSVLLTGGSHKTTSCCSTREINKTVDGRDDGGSNTGVLTHLTTVAALLSEVITSSGGITDPSTDTSETLPGVVDSFTEVLWEDGGIGFLD